MLKEQILTSLSLFHGRLDNIDNSKLYDFCIENIDRFSAPEISYIFKDINLNGFAKMPEYSQINYVVEGIKREFESSFSSILRLADVWMHINRSGQSTNMHHHVDVGNIENSPVFSVVYYVKAPKGCGRLVFDYPINQYETRRESIDPKEGNFVLFPAYLNHFVTCNASEDLRVSISCNFYG